MRRLLDLRTGAGTLFTKPTAAELAEAANGPGLPVAVPPHVIPELESTDPDAVGFGLLEVVL